MLMFRGGMKSIGDHGVRFPHSELHLTLVPRYPQHSRLMVQSVATELSADFAVSLLPPGALLPFFPDRD